MSKEVRTGLFAVIVLAATLFTVEYLKGKDIFSRTDTYYIIYPSVEGIDVSTAVTVGGYAAGRVSDVIYNRESGDYTVEISVSRNFPIPKDSRMDIYSSDILGTKKIKAVMGHSGTIAVSGDTLQGGIETDMLSSLAESIEPVALGLDTLVRSLNRTAESAKLILSDDNRGRIDGILQKIEDMTESLCVLADTVKGKSPEISEIISRLHSISSSLDSAAASAAVTVSNAEDITASLRDAGLNETVDSLRSLVIKLQDPSGSIGRLVTSDSLHNSLTRLTNDFDSLVRGIKEDPKKYIKISVF